MQLAIPPRVTDRAFARLAEIGAAPKALRVAVEGGGCSGFQYDIRLDDPAADDLVLEKDGARVLIDPVSLPFLADAEIDFADELIGARFVVNNPNATSSCGCGTALLDLTPGRALPDPPARASARAAPTPPPGGRFSPAGSGAALRALDRRRHRGPPSGAAPLDTRAAPRANLTPRGAGDHLAGGRPEAPSPTVPPGLQPGQRPPRPQAGASRPPGRAPPSAPRSSAATGRPPIPRRWTHALPPD